MSTPFKITQEHRSEFREAYELFDRGESGKLNCNQLGIVMRSIGQNATEAELYEMMNEVDADGEMNFQQFCSIMVKRLEALNTDEFLLEAFNIFDRDLDGYITTVEIKNIIYSVGERIPDDEFNLMMAEIDTNNDGVISFAEFVKAMRD